MQKNSQIFSARILRTKWFAVCNEIFFGRIKMELKVVDIWDEPNRALFSLGRQKAPKCHHGFIINLFQKAICLIFFLRQRSFIVNCIQCDCVHRTKWSQIESTSALYEKSSKVERNFKPNKYTIITLCLDSRQLGRVLKTLLPCSLKLVLKFYGTTHLILLRTVDLCLTMSSNSKLIYIVAFQLRIYFSLSIL